MAHIQSRFAGHGLARLVHAVLIVDGWAVDATTIRVMPGEGRGMGRHILNLYDRLLGQDPAGWPALLRSHLSFEARTARVPGDLSALLLSNAHLGQLGDRFPLGLSQRVSLLLLEGLESGQTLAVNGPPGTGKTTLLQSVFAHCVVKSALAGDNPPLVLVCSTNNQAITNVLDSCAGLPGAGGLFRRRLRGLSFAAFLKASLRHYALTGRPLLLKEYADSLQSKTAA